MDLKAPSRRRGKGGAGADSDAAYLPGGPKKLVQQLQKAQERDDKEAAKQERADRRR